MVTAPYKLNTKYIPLYTDTTSRFFIITGGRGSAKSFHTTDWSRKLTYSKGHKQLFTRYTMRSAKDSIIPEFNAKIEAYESESDFIVNAEDIKNIRTGGEIIFRGIKTSEGIATAKLKSLQGLTTWLGEEMEELRDEDAFDKINLSIRQAGYHNRVIAVLNPCDKKHFIYQRFFQQKGVPFDFNGVVDNVRYIHTSYLDNLDNLDAGWIAQAENLKQSNPHRYNHLFLGHWVDSVEGLLWNRALLDRLRIDTRPQLTRVVVAIDPASTANKNSDETGIVVVGRDATGNGYVLEDKSGRWTPAEWGLLATQAAKVWGADCIVAETNQGGDMVQQVIRNIDSTVRYKGVHATKGKYTRAEPIYNLYELGRVYHVGQHPILELQMCTFNPNEGDSPDRVDALVWGLTEVMLEQKQVWAF